MGRGGDCRELKGVYPYQGYSSHCKGKHIGTAQNELEPALSRFANFVKA